MILPLRAPAPIIINNINITSAWAVDWEFFDIYLPLWLPGGVFGAPLASPGPTLGRFLIFWGAHGLPLDLFGLPLAPLGSLWDPSGLGVPWGTPGGPFGVPGGALRCLGVPKAIFSDLSKIGRPIPSKCVHFTMPAHKKWPRGIHPRISRIPVIRPKWRKGRRSQPHFSRRGPG